MQGKFLMDLIYSNIQLKQGMNIDNNRQSARFFF